MNLNHQAKRILCYGDSNTWGWVPGKMGNERFNVTERWPGILQTLLGNEYEIIEEGLGGRTTMSNDPRPDFPLRNGLQLLPIILETHLPVDYVIVMLGTTDTKEMLSQAPQEITEGMRRIVQAIKSSKTLDGAGLPQILVVVPPIVREKAEFASKLFKGGTDKGKSLKEYYYQLSQDERVSFLDPTDHVVVDESEGVHLDYQNHKKLAEMIFATMQQSEKKV